MSQPWLEDLSEEWVPQPTSPSFVNNSDNQSATQLSQSVPHKTQSRLPRMRHSSGSFSEIQVRNIAKDLYPSRRRSALIERSLSDNNITSTNSVDPSNAAPSRCASQSFSGSLNPAEYDGTVAQKPASNSASKEKQVQNTPEWRRRLLKGEIGYGDQKDLFSPMGLENIFQKPHGNHHDSSEPKRRIGVLKGLSVMPSSPPPWSAEQLLQERSDVGTAGTRNNEELDALVQGQDSYVHEGSSATGITDASDASQIRHQVPRTISGQIEFENENFSPVYLSTNLRVGTQPQPIPSFRGSELANRLRNLGSPPPENPQLIIPEDESINQSRGDSSFVRLQDDSLPEDLPAGTPDLAGVGRFVELRRGGYSRDGSFRRRPLSPSPHRSNPQNANRTVRPASSPEPTARSEDPEAEAPKTPRQKEQHTHLSPERARNSGSPLKLFDAHDTFTSNRLQRRLSQLEHRSEKSASSSVQTIRTEITKAMHKTVRLTSVGEVSLQVGGNIADVRDGQKLAQRVETFGEGHLNEYQFSGDFLISVDESEANSAPDESPSMDVAPPGSRHPLKFQYDASPIPKDVSNPPKNPLIRTQSSSRAWSRSNIHFQDQPSNANEPDILGIQTDYVEGKRGPTSPFKNPTPKRRRTIPGDEDSIDNDNNDAHLQPARVSYTAMQSAVGPKQKDARYQHPNNIADPVVLAKRHILRPRNPTPSQRRLDELQVDILEATEAFILSSPKMDTIREHIVQVEDSDVVSEEARAALVANEVAAFSMKRQKIPRDESRKRSVTTQDFLDEAVKIMDYIRAKGRPTSGLASLEETESESPAHQEKSGSLSNSLTFDKPPSREGRFSAWKEPNRYELNPQMMSHLRKYQEGESDDALGSSFHSLRVSRIRGPTPPSEENSIVVEQDGIRITDNPNRHKMNPASDENMTGSQSRIADTHPSAASSMGQTIVTNTSRRSDHVATLAPEAVAHLIPKEVAGMSFDREKNIWIRQKGQIKEHRPDESQSGTIESEDDPFGNIPDLTVDETAERLLDNRSPARPQATAETFLEDSEEVKSEHKARPVTREGQFPALTDSSSVPSKNSNFAWSFPKTETRATSWSDQETRDGGTRKLQHFPTTSAILESEENDVEHEIKYFEGRETPRPAMRSGRLRDITISIAEQRYGDARDGPQSTASPQKKASYHWAPADNMQHSATRKTPWHHKKGSNTLPNTRPVRRPIFEDAEYSVLDELPSKNYRMQLSMSVSAPFISQKDALAPAPSSPTKADVTFMLSDLPEFTLNQVDECELPDRVVIKHEGHKFSRELEDRYALGTAELVKALQDTEPDEPYWEDLRQVDLRDKGLVNLHRLDEFCSRLEDLDISGNSISQVKGIPYTMRRLRASNNCLSGLTSWATLSNLQHLDISGNEIDSLDGLSKLVHLRTLKVNDNKIESLEEIFQLDGLMEVNAARNQIEFLDFTKANL